MRYYDEKGGLSDRLEAYYYMGSAYRDMEKPVVAAEWYQKAAALMKNGGSRSDSVVLASVYSQLADVYYWQLNNYDGCLEANKTRFALNDKLGLTSVYTYCLLARAYECVGKLDSAYIYYNLCSAILETDKAISMKTKLKCWGEQLSFFVSHNKKGDAVRCIDHIMEQANDVDSFPSNVCSSIGTYYLSMEKNVDSAIIYKERALKKDKSISNQMIYAKQLFKLYDSIGKREKALEYGYAMGRFYDMQDSLRTVSSSSGVSGSVKGTSSGKSPVPQIRDWQLIVWAVALLSLCSVFLWRYRRKMKELKGELGKMVENNSMLKREVETLRKENGVLTEKMEQKGRMLFNVSEVYFAFKEVVDKKACLNEDLWKRLFEVIDKSYPGFRDELVVSYPSVKQEEIQMVCLAKIGLSQTDIAKVLGVDSSTICRKIKKFKM